MCEQPDRRGPLAHPGIQGRTRIRGVRHPMRRRDDDDPRRGPPANSTKRSRTDSGRSSSTTNHQCSPVRRHGFTRWRCRIGGDAVATKVVVGPVVTPRSTARVTPLDSARIIRARGRKIGHSLAGMPYCTYPRSGERTLAEEENPLAKKTRSGAKKPVFSLSALQRARECRLRKRIFNRRLTPSALQHKHEPKQ